MVSSTVPNGENSILTTKVSSIISAEQPCGLEADALRPRKHVSFQTTPNKDGFILFFDNLRGNVGCSIAVVVNAGLQIVKNCWKLDVYGKEHRVDGKEDLKNQNNFFFFKVYILHFISCYGVLWHRKQVKTSDLSIRPQHPTNISYYPDSILNMKSSAKT